MVCRKADDGQRQEWVRDESLAWLPSSTGSSTNPSLTVPQTLLN